MHRSQNYNLQAWFQEESNVNVKLALKKSQSLFRENILHIVRTDSIAD